MADYNTAMTTINAIVTTLNTKPINLGQVVINLVNGTKELGSSLSTVVATAPVYNAVDLGLPSGRKWCDRNVGARSTSDYGEYFAWGDIIGNKPSYTSSTQYYQSSPPSVLPLARDAAQQNMGGSWRMPSKAEWDELMNNTTKSWTTVEGVYGRKVTSKKNSNWIFFPAAGSRENSSAYSVGSIGYYWSSSLNTSDIYNAYYLIFSSGEFRVSYDGRYYGVSVRAV